MTSSKCTKGGANLRWLKLCYVNLKILILKILSDYCWIYLCFNCVFRSLQTWWAAGAEHERLIGAELREESAHFRAGDPGGLPPVHGGHSEGLPFILATHYPSAVWKGHGRQLSLWLTRYAGHNLTLTTCSSKQSDLFSPVLCCGAGLPSPTQETGLKDEPSCPPWARHTRTKTSWLEWFEPTFSVWKKWMYTTTPTKLFTDCRWFKLCCFNTNNLISAGPAGPCFGGRIRQKPLVYCRLHRTQREFRHGLTGVLVNRLERSPWTSFRENLFTLEMILCSWGFFTPSISCLTGLFFQIFSNINGSVRSLKFTGGCDVCNVSNGFHLSLSLRCYCHFLSAINFLEE